MYLLIGLLGLITILAPFFLGYSTNPIPFWTSLILGIILLTMALLEAAAHNRQRWEYWIAFLAGIAAFTAPSLLGFSSFAPASRTLILVGVITVVFAGIKIFPKQY